MLSGTNPILNKLNSGIATCKSFRLNQFLHQIGHAIDGSPASSGNE